MWESSGGFTFWRRCAQYLAPRLAPHRVHRGEILILIPGTQLIADPDGQRPPSGTPFSPPGRSPPDLRPRLRLHRHNDPILRPGNGDKEEAGHSRRSWPGPQRASTALPSPSRNGHRIRQQDPAVPEGRARAGSQFHGEADHRLPPTVSRPPRPGRAPAGRDPGAHKFGPKANLPGTRNAAYRVSLAILVTSLTRWWRSQPALIPPRGRPR